MKKSTLEFAIPPDLPFPLESTIFRTENKPLTQVVLLLLLGFACLNVRAQKNNNVWVFADRQEIDINTTPPVFKQSSCYGSEGFASVCDDNGDLLFYSNGNKVWNGRDEIIENGTHLLGNTGQSTNQGVGIARVPNSLSLYYLFVLDAKEEYTKPGNKTYLRYNIVDISANGGKGAVISKNIILDSFMSEAMAFIPGNNNCEEYWLITRSNNDSLTKAYAAFKIDDQGIHSPVYSPGYYADALKFAVSHDGKKIVTVFYNVYLSSNLDIIAYPRPLEIGNFDPNTGKINDPMLFSAGRDITLKYGVAFSPDDSKFYFVNAINRTNQSSIGQIDMDFYPNRTAMENSTVFIKQNRDTMSIDFRYNNDGEILILNAPYYFSCIHNPNENGVACNYEDAYLVPAPDDEGNLLPLMGFSLPLPAFVAPVFKANSGDTLICRADDTEITLTIATNAGEDVRWNTGALGASITVMDDGEYIAMVNSGTCGILSDTIAVRFADVCACNPFIPSAFTPNGDGLNDEFEVKVSCRVYNYALDVFNRYGQRVFGTTNIFKAWDGTFNGRQMDLGTYFYHLSYKNVDGKIFSKKGDLTLIR